MIRSALLYVSIFLAVAGLSVGCASQGAPPSPPDPQAQASPAVPLPAPAAAGESGQSSEGSEGEGEGTGNAAGAEGGESGGSPGAGKAGEASDGGASLAESPPSGSAPSDAESQSALDRELASALSAFDRRMEQEQTAAASERRDPALSGQGGFGDESFSGRQGSPGRAPGTAAGGEEPSGGALGATAGGGADAGEDDRVPADMPDGADDDIVARQLREAAMAEDDPELREKLWEEYRKYKTGSDPADGAP